MMVNTKEPLGVDLRPLQRQIEAKSRQIGNYFCGTCNAKLVESGDVPAVIFKLILPGLDPLITPPIPLKAKLVPDPIEYFVQALHLSASKEVV